ncbi:reverse transcriptase domain-containing protein [Roseibium sp. RKSG952]|uniref:reverse transcriptase domain-containing protein n=1 Tax=Roseibium sp. RKSG952 TaxID=2529384 RepID=UPI0018AD163B|nr:reverse transcriptase domain-containing protein [Roseibium sp. RKSG952]
MLTPYDVDAELANPEHYEERIMRAFEKKRLRGQVFNEVEGGVSLYSVAIDRKRFAREIARQIEHREYRPQPAELITIDKKGRLRSFHIRPFRDQLVDAVLYKLMTHNANCLGMPGVYSYIPGVNNLMAAKDFAAYIRRHRARSGLRPSPIFVFQTDLSAYADSVPVGPKARIWPILKEIADCGSQAGEVSSYVWDVITEFARPVARDAHGALSCSVKGVPAGTPFGAVLMNNAVKRMDRLIHTQKGAFYARFNDDFLIAHTDLQRLRQIEQDALTLVGDAGVSRNLKKERRIALSGNGMTAIHASDYTGRDRLEFLGLSITHSGAIAVGPHRIRRILKRLSSRIDRAGACIGELPLEERVSSLVQTTNVMLDCSSPFVISGLRALLDTTDDRGTLKDLDFQISRKLVQVATGCKGIRGFRQVSPGRLRSRFGLVSLVNLKNLRNPGF